MKPVILLAAVAVLCVKQDIFAHVSYSGRDFGSLAINGPAITNNSQNTSGAFGWADATDENWGDSHRNRFFRFTLTNSASVYIAVHRNGTGTGSPSNFFPAVSLYYGLAHRSYNEGVWQDTGTGLIYRVEALAHDSSPLSVASRPLETEGSFRATAGWSIGNDDTYVIAGNPTSGVLIASRLVHFTYIGHLADGTPDNYGPAVGIQGDGNADGYVYATFNHLPAGDYSLVIGGANHGIKAVEAGPTYPTYGINVSIRASSISVYDAGISEVTSNPEAFDLYPLSSILDMNLGGLVIQGGEGNAAVRIQMQTTDDLEQPFEDYGVPIDIPIILDQEKLFIRINASSLP
ncbi:MAG TPA: hypothetical protein PJ991_02675 [Kiritimatiellia bacterium]|nr:hypothetical protein [Kiritimatiellia bacterium]